MIRKPLLKIDQLIARNKPPTKEELHEIRNDMNEAVCLLLRLKEYTMPSHLRELTEQFLAEPTPKA